MAEMDLSLYINVSKDSVLDLLLKFDLLSKANNYSSEELLISLLLI